MTRKRIKKYLETAKGATDLGVRIQDSREVMEFLAASFTEGPWCAEMLLRAIEVLEKLRDGPGNNMAAWKQTWAHEYAEKFLKEMEK